MTERPLAPRNWRLNAPRLSKPPAQPREIDMPIRPKLGVMAQNGRRKVKITLPALRCLKDPKP